MPKKSQMLALNS